MFRFWSWNLEAVGLGAVLAASTAFGASIILASAMSKQLAFKVESTRVLSYAKDVLRRNEQTSEQVAAGIESLRASDDKNPCSGANLARMQQIDVASSYLQAIGHVVGNQMVCSSIDTQPAGLDLGPPDFTTRLGFQIRQAVTFPFAPEQKFAVVAKDGFAVILHKDLPVDIAMDEADGALGIFTGNDRHLLMARGPVQAHWTQALPTDVFERVAVRDGHLIALLRSRQWSSGSLAAVPVRYLHKREREFATALLPVGLVTGLAFALTILAYAKRHRGLAHLLRRALNKKEFFLVYQPIVNLHSGRWVGVEALMRWRRPTGELVPPDVFIPIAEDAGLMQKVTAKLMELLANDVGDLLKINPDFHIAINVSSADLHADQLCDQIRHLLQRLNMQPTQLAIEATERGFLNPALARGRVQELRALGVQVGIDDFGTGYSSLAYLETFNVDALKIDKSFVDKVGTGAAASGVVGHIIEMAKALKLLMVAEGVETEVQAAYLRDRGVQLAQGWLFGKPMPMDELISRAEVVPRAAPAG